MPRSNRWSGGSAPRHEHRHAFAVAAIVIAEYSDQVALLKPDADQDVGRSHDGEQQVPLRHRWCGPERDDEAEIDRVPHETIDQRRAETRRRHRLAREIVSHLVQAEQLEMVDQEGARQHDQPTEE